MNSNLESTSQGELALTDWARIAGLLIVGAFVCFSIILFCKGANHPSANHPSANATPSVVQTGGLESRPESTLEARAKAIGAAKMETNSESAPVSSEALHPAMQPSLSGMATEKPAIANQDGVDRILKHRTFSVMRRHARPRRSPVDKVVLKSVNTVVEMWRRIFKARK
jgi:hypothetical protein